MKTKNGMVRNFKVSGVFGCVKLQT